MTNRKKRFIKILKDIKSVKIQGARNIALAGFKAYKLYPEEKVKKEIISIRPTEPFLINILTKADSLSYKTLIKKLKSNQRIINKEVYKLINKNEVIFTHCHSSTVVQALIYSKKKGKKFEVYLTETRPLFQGRKTAKELMGAGIKVTMFVDSAAEIALTKSQGTKKTDLVLLGTDAITNKGVINKVGSGMFAHIAKLNQIPVYILADSFKYLPKIEMEQRDYQEIWENKVLGIRIKNPAFELIKKKWIKGIISEFGLLSYREFLKKIKKTNQNNCLNF